MGIIQSIQAIISLRRIAAYLDLPELKQIMIKSPPGLLKQLWVLLRW
jgi:hypothetical protein